MKPSLLILAAGMASRYGGMKQIESFGPDGETIMDYSIYDAIRAGFGKVVFVIREDFAEQFKSIFEPKLKGRIQTEYVYQHLDAHLDGYDRLSTRSNPWGTAHAVLCARDVIQEPFAVINADDFYGRDAFQKAYAFLSQQCSAQNYFIIGYQLEQTLSDHGTVNRGVCSMDELGNLVGVTERLNISRHAEGVVCDDGLEPAHLQLSTIVSMNFWCFHPSVFAYTHRLFQEFLQARGKEEKSEFFIPLVADQFIHQGEGKVEVIPTSAIWFGVTYKEDAPAVRSGIEKLLGSGEYPMGLWK
ncbi:MAG: nucleotidyltransferase [Bacteroidetes bacterium]|nr:nucleotidyltransferase [Bacteroidota bacterium]